MDDVLNLPENPTLADMQRYVARMIEVRGFHQEVVAETFMLFTEECGELAKAIRKVTLHHDPSSDHHDVDGELADVFMYVLDMANKLGVDLEAAFRKKEEKNKLRTWTKA